MADLIWFLLPLAAASGWLAARRSGSPDKKDESGIDCGPIYYKGLNFLLNEQPDKAIEVFIEMLEVDSETVETHIALGNLFRRRGEVDRAIRIHQNLIARPNLASEQRSQALLELGQDYMKAGLLDRAESLFHELIELRTMEQSALENLVSIYEQEQDWANAIECAQKLDRKAYPKIFRNIAQYNCELADQAKRDQNFAQVAKLVKSALSYDGTCVRALMLQAELDVERSSHKAAIKTYQRIVKQSPRFVPEVLKPLSACYRQLGQESAWKRFLEELLQDANQVRALAMYLEILEQDEGVTAAVSYLEDFLKRYPSVKGLEYLVSLRLRQEQVDASMRTLQAPLQQIVMSQPAYQCRSCGFKGQALHWQCPSCKRWGRTLPFEEQ